MRTSPLAASLLAPLLLLAVSASAAPPPPPPPAHGAPPAAPPAAPAPSTPSAPLELPKVDVTDPLLTPVAPPARTLAGWRDALTAIAARSVDLAIARQEVERAEGLSRQALALALPTIDASGSVSYEMLHGGSSEAVSIRAQQAILAPRAWYGIGTAKRGVDSAKLTADDKRRTILAQVANAIVGVFTAERVAEINRVGLRNALQHQNLADRKTRLGDGTRLDVLRAQQDVATARATIISSDEALLKAREALGLALGSSDAWGVPPTISLDELQQSLQSSCASGTLDQRADIAAARVEVDIANRQITDVKLAFSPTALVETTAAYNNNSAVGGASSWSIQGVLSIPLWDGGARYGSLRIARAGAEEAKIKLDAARRGATFEVTQALRSVGVAESARLVAEQNRDLSREAARLAERAFAAGAGTSLDLVDASRREREGELDLAVREFELIKARISALLATSNCAY